ncbi:hypothetical protein [Novosphingobium taihuense]|uniref:Uncharacterized protein n=1 Tax=Novosphingobium taihuense TaxID=260085 RepID=A0A7W7EVN9_9SPHN|nr:hypothetical protein [Novosphingobium taihuense]MBB4615256.1 hypothetical protein [Novosphingobium taihuense]TWH84291.1 hypothetical protein IQ25_02718 [Novosphingobium taihuense]
MITTASRLRSIGWLVLLGLCLALVMVLAFRVNALRSQIHHAEARIVALKQEKMYLETEFETRSNQQQLKTWNDVEFGYTAPNASQYLEGERQLAELSLPSRPDAPAPIRVASVDDSVIASAAFPAMVSPLTGKVLASNDRKVVAVSDEDDSRDDRPSRKVAHDEAVETLKDRLGKVVDARPRGPVRKETASDKERPAKKVEAKVSKTAKEKPAVAKADKAKPKAKAVATADKSAPKKDKSPAAPRAAKGKEAKAAR